MLPFRLSDLALEAFGKYLSDVVWQSSTENFNEEYLDQFCKELEQLMCNAVPCQLADHVTQILIAKLLETYSLLENVSANKGPRRGIRCGNKRILYVNTTNVKNEKQNHKFKQVTIAICAAVLHPSLKEFNFSRFHFARVKFSEAKIFVNAFLDVVLKKVSNIKCLKLEIYEYDENIIMENMKAFHNLEELTFFGCSDAIVDTVSVSCKKIRFLDLRNSEKVTESSVKSILKLKFLQHLNIRWTSIPPHGIEEIVHGLQVRDAIHPLRSFHSVVLPYQVGILAKHFPNLTSVELHIRRHYSLIPLKELKQLSHLGIYFALLQSHSSIDLEELLESTGSQLSSLKLILFRQNQFIDYFTAVAAHCTRLEDLVLSTCPVHINESEAASIQQIDLPVLKSVNFLEIKVYHIVLLQAMLSKCENVKFLNCYYNEKNLESFVIEQLFKMKSGKLEQLCINNRTFQVSGDNIILSMNGAYMFVHSSQIEHFIDDILYTPNYIDTKRLCFSDEARVSLY